jgi:MYXO-CTERM domain-containing protein
VIFPVHVPEQPPSPRVQELGHKLTLAIAEFQQRNPDLSAEEIRAAAQLATNQVDAPRGVAPRAVTAVVAGVVAVGLGAWLTGASPGGHPPLVAIGALVVAALAVIAAVRRRT